jgi:hypothetical protein
MIFSKRPIHPDDREHPQAALMREQAQYLWGVLLADSEFREDRDCDVSLIDPYGTGTKAFWRGFLESCGKITVKASGGADREYPLVSVTKVSYQILVKFLAFMQEEVYTRNGCEWQWDADGKLEWQAKGRFLRISGQKAQDVVRVLYIGETVGRESARRMADRIVQWAPRNVR